MTAKFLATIYNILYIVNSIRLVHAPVQLLPHACIVSVSLRVYYAFALSMIHVVEHAVCSMLPRPHNTQAAILTNTRNDIPG